MNNKKLVLRRLNIEHAHYELYSGDYIKYKELNNYEYFMCSVLKRKKRVQSIKDSLTVLGFSAKLIFPFITRKYNIYMNYDIEYYQYTKQNIDLSSLNSIWYYPPKY